MVNTVIFCHGGSNEKIMQNFYILIRSPYENIVLYME